MRWLFLGCLFCVAPFNASAALLRFNFTSEIDGISSEVANRLGVAVGDTITGGFLFDDQAPQTSFEHCDACLLVDNDRDEWSYRTSATYDLSQAILFGQVGGYSFGATGGDVLITDVDTLVWGADVWRWDPTAIRSEMNGLTVESMSFVFEQMFGAPLTSAALQVPDPGRWFGYGSDERFLLRLGDGLGIGSHVTSITKTVPEPATLLLLTSAIVGAAFTPRRRRAMSSVA